MRSIPFRETGRRFAAFLAANARPWRKRPVPLVQTAPGMPRLKQLWLAAMRGEALPPNWLSREAEPESTTRPPGAP